MKNKGTRAVWIFCLFSLLCVACSITENSSQTIGVESVSPEVSESNVENRQETSSISESERDDLPEETSKANTEEQTATKNGFVLCEEITLSSGETLELGISEKFTTDEVVLAAESLIAEMFADCKFTFLRYDESYSDELIEEFYLVYGRGRKNGASAENVLVFIGDFIAGPDSDVSLNINAPESTRWENCMFIMLRDKEFGTWIRDDWGIRW